MADILSLIQSRFPKMYDVYNKDTHIYKILSVYANRAENRDKIIDRLYRMLDIDDTLDEDLEHRWGSLLGIKRMAGEGYDAYRKRLQIVYASFAGGTAEAIKYAIASVIGISSDAELIDRYINVYDAWEYGGDIPEGKDIPKEKCHIICVVDLSIVGESESIEQKIYDAVQKVKASGVMHHIILMYTAGDVARVRVSDECYDDIVIIKCGMHSYLGKFPTDVLMFFTNEELGYINISDNMTEATFDAIDELTFDTLEGHVFDVIEQYGVRKV